MQNTVNIDLNVQELNVVLLALSKLPLETTIDVFLNIRNQAEQQLNQSSDIPKGPLSDKIIV